MRYGHTAPGYGGTPRPRSDLDLVAFASPEQRGAVLRLREAFDESSLPFSVDLLIWDDLPESFHRNIEAEYVALQTTKSVTNESDWPLVPFAQVLEEPVRNGIYKRKEFHGNGVKIVNMGELFAHPRLSDVSMRRVELSDSEQNRFSVQAGDLLFARRSLVAEGAGRCCLVLQVNEPTAFESSIIRARPDTNKADPQFLYYHFNSPYGLHTLDTIRRQVAVAGITGTDLAQLTVPLPPLPEQRAIAHILGALDDKIELNRRMNQTLEEMARAIFKDWFVDFGPVRAKLEGREPYLPPELWDLFPNRLVDSELGEAPEGWGVRKLGDCYNLTMGQSPPGSSYNDRGDGLPFFQGKAEFGSRYPSHRRFCAEPKRKAKQDDTLVSVRAPVGALNMAWGECCIGRGVAAIRHKSGSRSFTYYSVWTLQPELQEFEQTGTVFGAINKNEFEGLTALEPPGILVNAFENSVNEWDERIRLNVAETHSLAAQRDGLLPGLVSGEVRVGSP